MVRISLVIIGLGCSILSGCCCSPPHAVDIDGADHDSTFAEGEVVIALHRPYLDSSRRRVSNLSLGYTQTKGQFHQTIDADEYVDFNRVRIDGPTRLNNEAELGVAYARYVRHMFRNDRSEWYWGGGAGYSNLDFTTSANGQRINEGGNALGPHGIIGASHYFTPTFGVDASAAQYLFFLDNNSMLYELRAQLLFTPVEAVRLFAGYRHWGYSFSPHNSNSDILFDFYGPSAGVTLRF